MVEKVTGAADGSERKTLTINFPLDKEYTVEEINAFVAQFLALYQ